MLRILKYNMFLNYYRVFSSRFFLNFQVVLQIVITTLLPSHMLLNIIVNKGRLQLELSVSYLSISFELTLPELHREIQNTT